MTSNNTASILREEMNYNIATGENLKPSNNTRKSRQRALRMTKIPNAKSTVNPALLSSLAGFKRF
jgi:hypothetical protein